jgi:hypothetical protein
MGNAESVTSDSGQPGIYYAGDKRPLVVLTVPHSACGLKLGVDIHEANKMDWTDLIELADTIDRHAYPETARRMCDRRALQAALLLRAAFLIQDVGHDRIRVLIFANTEEPREECDSNRFENCHLEEEVVRTLAPLLNLEGRPKTINIDVHSFPTRGKAGDVLDGTDNNHVYFLTRTANEMKGLAGWPERRGTSANLFLNAFPEQGVESVLVEFHENKAEYPFSSLEVDCIFLAKQFYNGFGNNKFRIV